MSKYILAGISVAEFFKTSGLHCWVVKSSRDSEKLQKQLQSRASKLGVSVGCHTLVSVDLSDSPSVKYTVIAEVINV